jgi:thermitase
MRFRTLILGLAGALLSAHVSWAQLDTETPAQPSLDPKQISAPFVPGELVVGLESGNLALPLVAMEMVGTITAQNPPIQSFVIKLAPNLTMQDAGEFLRTIPGVRYVEPNYLAFAFATPNDPRYSQQYGPQRIQANLAWDIWQPQRTVYIAIIDTGIDSNHPDLTNKMRRHTNGAVYGWNTLNNTTNALDDNGHGTHCAGIAAAEINNGVGIAGVAAWNPNVANSRAYVQLMPVKVLSASGSGSYDSVARGITWAADNGAHILSLSLGGAGGSQQLQDAVNYAWNRGCLVVVAAGNGASSSPQYPAFYTNSIAVAATDSSDRLASFSQYGSWVDIAAPGVGILSTIPNNSYTAYDGTSMACPHVAGAAAVLWSHNGSLTNAQLRSALETNVDPYQPFSGRTIAPNAGRLNVYRALQAVSNPTQPSLSSLSLNPTSVVGGNSSTGTVTLSGPAPSGGFVVSLSSSNTNVATVPSTVTVPAGATSANFTVSTQAVSSATSVTITASAGGVSRSATLTVNPPSSGVTLQSLTISPTSVVGGNSATGTVTLSGPAPSGGFVVSLSSSNTNVATVPSTVTVPAGATSANFTISTRAVSSATSVTITASAGGVSRSATLTVNPSPSVTLQSLTISPTNIVGGNTATGTVTLSGPAPAGGVVVQLRSSSSRASVPSTVTVPAGATSARFTIQTRSTFWPFVETVTITASYNGVSRSAQLTVWF